MKEKRKFSSELKTQIVLSVIKNELTALEAAKKHEITTSLVYKWRDEFLAKASTVFDTNKAEVEKDKKMKHYEYVITKLTTQNDFLEKVLAVTK
jgi:transposase-like protein